MTTEVMVHIGRPGGAAVHRRFAGKYYSLLAVGPSRCLWHRTYRDTVETAACETPPRCESSEAWPYGEIRKGALKGLPRYQLPDLRTVVFVPHVRDFGVVLEGEYSLIKQAAKASHGVATGHGYRNLSTRMRQRWFEFSESPRRRSAPALEG
jgi:hypothetical protein